MFLTSKWGGVRVTKNKRKKKVRRKEKEKKQEGGREKWIHASVDNNIQELRFLPRHLRIPSCKNRNPNTQFLLYDSHVDKYYLVGRGSSRYIFKHIQKNFCSFHTVQNRKCFQMVDIFVGHENYCLPATIYKKKNKRYLTYLRDQM